MVDWPRTAYAAGFASIILAFVLLFASGLFDFQVGALIALLLIVVGALGTLAGLILYILEIAKAKNEGNWKAIWLIAILALGIIGIVLYELMGRKEMQR